MNLTNLANNLTFAILKSEDSWRTDLTLRFCQYFGHKINGQSFSEKIIFVDSIDEAISECKTDFLLTQAAGHLPLNRDFFETLESSIVEAEDIFIGHIILENDYLVLDKRCLFINIPLWKDAGSPPYVDTQVREGPFFQTTAHTRIKSQPGQIAVVEPIENIFVTGSCGLNGAAIAIKQLQKFGTATSFAGVSEEGQAFWLDTSKAFHEINTETIFEKKYRAAAFSKVYVTDANSPADVKNTQATVVVAPAQGLRPLNLVEHFRATKAIIYDINPDALELQRRIFSIEQPMVLGDIIEQFIKDYPSVEIADDWSKHKYDAITPLPSVEVEYKLVDVFSFEIIELARSFDHSPSAVFDFSDIFAYPFNYYKRPLYQVSGLFAELFSILGSRTGPTHIMGFAPEFRSMDRSSVNTSTTAFKMDATLLPEEQPVLEDEEELTQEMLDAAAEDGFILGGDKVQDVVAEAAPTVNAADEVKATEIVPEIQQEPIAQQLEVATVKPVVEVQAVVEQPSVSANPITLEKSEVMETAASLGFTETHSATHMTIISQETQLEHLHAVFEYHVDFGTYAWSFKVGKVGGEKRVEFSNGKTKESLLKHLHMNPKINSRTAAKYFA